MTTDSIKELVARLKYACTCPPISNSKSCVKCSAADALEAMAGEVEDSKSFLVGAEGPKLVRQMRGEVAALTEERDRLAGEVERWRGIVALRDSEVERLKAQVRFASETDPAMRAEAAEAERDRLKAAVTTHIAGCAACGVSGVAFLCPERDDTAEAVREDCEECVGLRKALGGDAS